MSFAFLALYTGDYLRDTRHLTPLKHGVYLLLLMHCWDSRGPVPLDEQECAGIANCRSSDEIDALRYVLAKYFTRMDDGHYNKRMDREIQRANALSSIRQQAAFVRHKGRDASAMQMHSKSTTLATNTTPTITPTTTPIPTPVATTTKTKVKNTSPASRLSIDKLPDDWALWSTTNRPDLISESVFEQFRDYWIAVPGTKGKKLDWFATWRNWCRNQGRTAMGKKTLVTNNNAAMDEFERKIRQQTEKDVTNG